MLAWTRGLAKWPSTSPPFPSASPCSVVPPEYPIQVKMQKGERQMAKRFLEERKEELEEVAHELAETEHENTVLRHNIERIKEEKDFTM